MADEYGQLEIPVQTPTLTSDDAAGDPLLSVLGSYLQAVINAKCGTAWAALFPTESPVLAVRFTDPNEAVFDERDLPALFLFRGAHALEHIADDWDSDRGTITVLWIPPPSNLDRKTEHSPFANAIAKTLHRALSQGNDPAWIATGDTSAASAVYGSSLALQASLLRTIESVRVETVPIMVEAVDSSGPRRYTGARATFEAVELYEADPQAYPGTYPSQLHADINREDGSTRQHVTPAATLIDGGFAASTDADYEGSTFDAGIP